MSERDSVTVAIVGAGEMGAAVGRRLREAGARVMTSLAGRSAESVARVRDAGLEVVNDDDSLVRDASFVLSIVPPGVAVEVAERLRGPLGRAQAKPVFVECNAISPATCRAHPRPARRHHLHRRRHYRRTARRRYSRSRQGSALLRLWRRRASADASGRLRSRHLDSRRSSRRRVRFETRLRRPDEGLHRAMRDDAGRGGTRGSGRRAAFRTRAQSAELSRADGSLSSRDASEGVPLGRRDASDRGVRRQSRRRRDDLRRRRPALSTNRRVILTPFGSATPPDVSEDEIVPKINLRGVVTSADWQGRQPAEQPRRANGATGPCAIKWAPSFLAGRRYSS